MTSRRVWSASILAMCAACVAYAVACGEDYGADGAEGERETGPTGSDSAVEAAMDATSRDAGPCDLDAPFSKPVPLDGVNSADDEGKPRISPDELTVHFTRRANPAVAQVIHVAVRPARTSPFGTPRPIALATPSGEVIAPSFTADFLVVAFADLTDGGDTDLFLARRDSVLQSFGNSAPIDGLNTDATEGDPFLSPDGLTMYFVSYELGTFRSRIYRATRSAGAPFSAVTEVDVANDSPSSPAVTADDTTLFFRADVSGNSEIFMARRRSTTDAFGKPVIVTEVNSADFDEVGSVSPDGCRLYIRSGREGGAGRNDIWIAERPAAPKP
jgi:Tol biopolymer transport system component